MEQRDWHRGSACKKSCRSYGFAECCWISNNSTFICTVLNYIQRGALYNQRKTTGNICHKKLRRRFWREKGSDLDTNGLWKMLSSYLPLKMCCSAGDYDWFHSMSWSSWAPMVRMTSLPGHAFSEVIQAIHFAVFTDSKTRPHLKTKASSDCELQEYYSTPHTLPRLTNESPGISRSAANHTISCAPVTVSVMQTTPVHLLVSAPRPVTLICLSIAVSGPTFIPQK